MTSQKIDSYLSISQLADETELLPNNIGYFFIPFDVPTDDGMKLFETIIININE